MADKVQRCGTIGPHAHRWTPFPSDARFEHCKCGATRRSDRISDNPCVQLWGRGPDNERCATCAHLVKMSQAKTWFKCDVRSDLTHSARTDQRVGWEACARWELNPDFKRGGKKE